MFTAAPNDAQHTAGAAPAGDTSLLALLPEASHGLPSARGTETASRLGSQALPASPLPYEPQVPPRPAPGSSTWVSAGGSSVLARLLLRYLSLSFLSMV